MSENHQQHDPVVLQLRRRRKVSLFGTIVILIAFAAWCIVSALFGGRWPGTMR